MEDFGVSGLFYAFVRTAFAVAAVVAFTRLNGLKTFSKMTGFDFALTLAIGSTLAGASMANSVTAYASTIATMAALFVMQRTLTYLRQTSETVRERIDNGPLLLMLHGEIIEKNLERGNVTRADLMAKLREANALQFQNVHAVVLETTGDVSVMHGSDSFDEALLEEVAR